MAANERQETPASPTRVVKDPSVMRDLKIQLQTAKINLTELSTLAQKGDERLVEKFLSENVQVDIGSDDVVLQSQLYVAAFWGFYDVLKALLNAGADINHQNKGTLWTPLHAATFQEHGKVVMLLLERNAQPELEDSEGRTPKDFASASDKIWGHFAVLGCPRTSKETLIEKGIIKKIERPSSSTTSLPTSVIPSVPTLGRLPGSGIRMAAYSRPDSAYAIRADPFQKKNRTHDSSQMAALLGGDVLAEENVKPRQSQDGSQPQFSLWRS
ncbi:inactive serine/threonine-protein kinase TEX14-like [Saccoglossus kowalevskii]|uniref:E3 ubiquitin-protein ligase mib1-like n=1 Tax=Saccoglossus kowalevskii TaxID=10224 RepID=A0ABM0GYK0_SACKO|nr:PREDICTED: E3 ubiquitin-protein ligase mib1-like [Saccoglossus kowalevskii]